MRFEVLALAYNIQIKYIKSPTFFYVFSMCGGRGGVSLETYKHLWG